MGKKHRRKKNKIKNQGANMGNNVLKNLGRTVKNAASTTSKWGRNYGWNGFTYNRPTEPKDGEQLETLNLVLFSQKFLNDLAAKCLPKAGGAEFQTHYRAVQIIVQSKNPEEDQSRLVFTVPTIFFNFPQEVTSGSVKFDLREVKEISDSYKDESMQMAQKIIEQFPTSYFQQLGFDVKIREGEIGSIHRHPGDFSFSSIDLDKDPTNPGVIYRQAAATDHIQTDSVLYMQANNFVKLVTTQTRVVDVQPTDDGGVDGTYKRTKTIAMIHKDAGEPVDTEVKKEINFAKFFTNEVVTDFEVSEHLKAFLNRFDKISEDQAKDFLDKAAMVFKIALAKGYYPKDYNDPERIKPLHYGGYTYGGYSYGGYNRNISTTGINTTTTTTTDDSSPEDHDLDEVLADMGFKDLETSVSINDFTDMELRQIYWSCCGNLKSEVNIFCKDGTVTISEFNKYSSVFQVEWEEENEAMDYLTTRSRYLTKGDKEELIVRPGEGEAHQELKFPDDETSQKVINAIKKEYPLFLEDGKITANTLEAAFNEDKLAKLAIIFKEEPNGIELKSEDGNCEIAITPHNKNEFRIDISVPGFTLLTFINPDEIKKISHAELMKKENKKPKQPTLLK